MRPRHYCTATRFRASASCRFAAVCADVLSVSGHKIHGPKGIRSHLHKRRREPSGVSYAGGGSGGAARRSGTENVPAIAGLGLAAEMAERTDRSVQDSASNWQQIRQRPDVAGLTAALGRHRDKQSGARPGRAAGECCSSLLNVSLHGDAAEKCCCTRWSRTEYTLSTGSACSSNKKGRSHVLSGDGALGQGHRGDAEVQPRKDVFDTMRSTLQRIQSLLR